MRKNIKSFLQALSLVFCLVTITFGQSTSGSIEGVVKDEKGAVIPGASVTVEGLDVGFKQTVQTGNDGFYRLKVVPAGNYRVTVAPISGFAESKINSTQVVIEKVTRADVTVGISENVVNVEVAADPLGVVVDTSDSKIQSNITSELIDQLPKGTSFTSVLRASPATRQEAKSGGFQIDGASGSENTFIIDGQEVTNFRTGALNSVNNIPTALVREVQIKTSGFEAEHGGASGGVISIGTKSGSDEFHGEFGSQFEISKFQPNNRFVSAFYQPNATTQIPYHIQQPKDDATNFFPTALLSGPVIKNRLWFLGSYSPQIFETSRDVNYYGSNPTNLQINPLYPQTDNYNTKTRFEYALARLDGNITNNIRAFATYLWNPAVYEGVMPLNAIAVGGTPASAFGLRGPDLAGIQGGRTNSNTLTTQVAWTPTSKMVATFRYGHGFLNERGTNAYGIANETRFQCSGLASSPVYTNGTAGCIRLFQNTLNNSPTTRDVSKRNTFNADLGYTVGLFGGNHSFKGGYEYGTVKNDVSSGYSTTGIVTLQYGRDFNFYGVSFSCAAIPNCIGVGRMQRFGTLGVASNRYQGLYIQDKWQVTDRLTLNLGVRAESENLPAFNTGEGRGGTPIEIPWGRKIAPRLGGAFDLFGNGRSRIFASYGWFYDRLKFELPRGSFGGDFFRRDYFPILSTNPQYSYYTPARILGNFTDPIGGGDPSTAGGLSIFQGDFRIPSNLTPEQFQALGLPIGGVDPNLKPFRQSEFTVGYEQEINPEYVLSARYTRKNVEDAIEDQANLGLFEAEAYIIGNTGVGFAYDSRLAAGVVKQTTAQRLYNAFEISLTKRLSHNYFFSANYTLSSLYGNYSGLASSDENGRTSPGVTRSFDYPINGFTATGEKDNGRLATDRPHVLKVYGGYTWDWWNNKNNSTDLTFFTSVASGTPQTTFITVVASAIPLSKRNDLGRTPALSSTDFSLSHSYRFGRDSKYKLVFDVNLLNAFNQNAVTSFDTDKYINVNAISADDVDPNYDPETMTLIPILNQVLNGNVGPQLQALDTADNRNQRYGKANGYQAARNVRFGFRFVF